MTESWWQAVKRRWQNIQWAKAGIDRFVDEDGHEYVGADVDKYLDSTEAEDAIDETWIEHLYTWALKHQKDNHDA